MILCHEQELLDSKIKIQAAKSFLFSNVVPFGKIVATTKRGIFVLSLIDKTRKEEKSRKEPGLQFVVSGLVTTSRLQVIKVTKCT